MNVEIRPYRSSDHTEVTRVWYESTLSSADPTDIGPNLRAELFDRIPRELASGWSLYVAIDHERVVGMLALRPSEDYLHQLFIDPPFQKRGIGKALLDFAKEKMPQGFTLNTMTANRGARRFYEREGLLHRHDEPHPISGGMRSKYEWGPEFGSQQ